MYKILKFSVILVLIFAWIFGYPPVYENLWRARIWEKPAIPPQVQVAHAATFGRTVAGTTDHRIPTNSQQSVIIVGRYQITENGTLNSISFYAEGRDNNVTSRAVIYSDNAGAPGNLLDSSTDTNIWCNQCGGSWWTFTGFTALSLTANSYYWLGVSNTTLGRLHHFDATGVTNQTAYQTGTAAFDPPPNPFGTPTYEAKELSVYATYTPGGVVSVAVSDGAVAWGIVKLGTTKSTTSGELNDTQIVTNNGTVTENFTVISSDATGGTTWQLAATAGLDAFTYQFSANSGPPYTWTSFNIDNTTYVTLATNVTANATVPMNIQIGMPTDTTDYVTKTINITIQALQ